VFNRASGHDPQTLGPAPVDSGELAKALAPFGSSRMLPRSSYLDPAVLAEMPTFTLHGTAVEWRPNESELVPLWPETLLCPQSYRCLLEPESAGAELLRGAFHVLSLLTPYLDAAAREHLLALVGNYQTALPKR
jgi:hypothetical protein